MIGVFTVHTVHSMIIKVADHDHNHLARKEESDHDHNHLARKKESDHNHLARKKK